MTYSSPDRMTPDTLQRPPRVWADRRSYSDVTAKFSWMDRLPNFLSCGALLRCTKAPARSSAIITPQTAKNTRWPLWRNKKEQNFESSIARLQFTEFIRKCEVSKVGPSVRAALTTKPQLDGIGMGISLSIIGKENMLCKPSWLTNPEHYCKRVCLTDVNVSKA